ncbi:ribosome biogenesis GTP-binding protein YihA/YsxC [Magnetospirillum fulvum]|uniref:Probable GTP-binding protein EngB n=1 Tax=Magnetospirillum fulvum TaxID=1082 RepID=A0A1H6II34_MAGFU|nr:ribosome biogenesis GTP-binding protein YihA/YsxC [Magnetospirillum fulvum]SEH48511.1 GTP-binding protein [Magnetospirillum fulvum]
MDDHASPGSKALTSDPTPSTGAADADPVETGRLLFARECRFMMGGVSLDALPPADLPELAFAGRSNVGKSSILNALTGRKTLARTSNTPGRTQELNFFDLGGRLILVDMPGYGFASAPKAQVERWTRLIEGFLRGRTVLRRVIVLVDSRHGLKDSDRTMMKMLDQAAVVYQVVLTKADKISESALAAVTETVRAEIASRVAAHPTLIATSSETGLGIAELRAELAALARGEKTQR